MIPVVGRHPGASLIRYYGHKQGVAEYDGFFEAGTETQSQHNNPIVLFAL